LVNSQEVAAMSDTTTEQDSARQRLGVWWAQLDPTVQRMFEELAAEQPDLVYRVISGGTVTPAEGQTLGEHLAVDYFEAQDNVPAIFMSERPTVEPQNPEPGTPFKVRWQEQVVKVAPQSHRTTVTIFDESNNQVAEQELSGLNGAGARELEFKEGLPNEGSFYALVMANADGVDPGQPATEQGYRTSAGSEYMLVGSYSQAAGPSGAQGAYRDLASEMYMAGAALMGSVSEEGLAAAVAAARRLLATAPAEADMQQYISRLDNLTYSITGIDERAANRDYDQIRESQAYLSQAASVFNQLDYRLETFTDNGPYLVETLTNLVTACVGR